MHVELSPSQYNACEAFQDFLCDPNEKEFLLSGFAGSGKTFLVKYLVKLARDEHELSRLINPTAPAMTFHFTATTNKAATVLGEAMGEEAITIHRALGLTLRQNYKTGQQYLEKNKNKGVDLNYSTLIVDEASMINRELLQHIQKAIADVPTCKVLYVGDKYQLPPVKETTCPIFRATRNSHFLTDIQRQAADSPIITFSHEYRRIMDDRTHPWPAIPHDGEHIFYYTKAKEWEQLIKDTYLDDVDPDEVRILAWSNSRVIRYNKFVRTQLGHTTHFCENEYMLSNNPILIGERVIIPTDGLVKIINVEETQKDGIDGHEIRVQNHRSSATFTVFQPLCWKTARQHMAKLAKNKQWPEFYAIKNEWGDFRPPHAQTVHKSQGSTYRKVFIDVQDIAQNNKWEEVARLMYVAVTRASHEVHIFGNIRDRYDRGKSSQSLMEKFTNATQVQSEAA